MEIRGMRSLKRFALPESKIILFMNDLQDSVIEGVHLLPTQSSGQILHIWNHFFEFTYAQLMIFRLHLPSCHSKSPSLFRCPIHLHGDFYLHWHSLHLPISGVNLLKDIRVFVVVHELVRDRSILPASTSGHIEISPVLLALIAFLPATHFEILSHISLYRKNVKVR